MIAMMGTVAINLDESESRRASAREDENGAMRCNEGGTTLGCNSRAQAQAQVEGIK